MQTKKYIVIREIEAKSIVDAIKKERKGKLVQVYEIDNKDESKPNESVGFQSK